MLEIRKGDKNNFRTLKKAHAYLQTIVDPIALGRSECNSVKASVKFNKTDRPKTVGVARTKYLLEIRNHALRTTQRGKPKSMSLSFSSKRRGTIKGHRSSVTMARLPRLFRNRS